MSYGYLIASSSPILEIQKSRRFKFVLLDSSDKLYLYSRLEESNELTIRDGQKSIITDTGKSFIFSIPPPFFFMDYLLTNNHSEIELIHGIKKDIKEKNFRTFGPSNIKELTMNHLYMVTS